MDEVQQAALHRRRHVESDEEVSKGQASQNKRLTISQSNFDGDSIVDAPWRAHIFEDNDQRL